MLPPRDRRNSALRVSFIGDSEFQRLDAPTQQKIKAKVLHKLHLETNWPTIEHKLTPDITFHISKNIRGVWILRKSTTGDVK